MESAAAGRHGQDDGAQEPGEAAAAAQRRAGCP
jgi:hypothetical protein